jgi:hypothetical protein
MNSFNPASKHHQQQQDLLPFIQLEPLQSCILHGWANPRRTLSWEDVCKNKGITIQKCMDAGLSLEDVRSLQPDPKMWVRHKGVSLSDVELMVAWPLHPINDLEGNISDLVALHYQPHVHRALGITYSYLRTVLGMDDEWMRMMQYTPLQWAEMDFTKQDAVDMGRRRIYNVFGMDYDCLILTMASCPSSSSSVAPEQNP